MKCIKDNSNCTKEKLLSLFGEGESGAVSQTADAAEKSEVSGEATGDAERRAKFDSLIKGEFKDLFDERVKNAVMRRFRSERKPEGKLTEKAAEGSSEKPVDDEPRRIVESWLNEEAEVKMLYPSFSLRETAMNAESGKRFMALLSAGFSVRDAYEALNKDKIMSGMMRYAAERVREKTLGDIRRRGLRPSENGSAAQAVSLTSRGPESWTEEEMLRVAQRVKRGERIVL